MDFEDILNQWDNQQKKSPAKKMPQVSHKKANAPTKEEKEAARQGYTYEQIMERDSKRRMNPMEVWLNRHGTVDKDKLNEQNVQKQKFESVEYLRSMAPQATLDLHQLTKDEAWNRLNSFVTECHAKKLKKILIIHGKGIHSHGSDSVLGPMVKMFVEQDKRLGMSGHPDKNHGGGGATWVIIK